MIQHVVDGDAGAELDVMAAKREVDRVLNLGVEREEGGKPPCPVLTSDEVPVLIETRIGKAGVHVEDGDEVELVRQADDVPEEAAVRRVGGERPVLVGTDQRIREVSEELVVVVQVAVGAGVNVAGVDRRSLVEVPAEHGEKLAIALFAVVEQKELRGAVRLLNRIDVEVAVDLALLIAETNEEIAAEFAVELKGPAQAVGNVEPKRARRE